MRFRKPTRVFETARNKWDASLRWHDTLVESLSKHSALVLFGISSRKRTSCQRRLASHFLGINRKLVDPTILATTLVFLCLAPALVHARATIITDPDDTTTRFQVPASTQKSSKKQAYPIPAMENPAAGKNCTEEGRTRYNGAPDIKAIEFCDGTAWVALMRTAPTANTNAPAACTQGDEGLMRYNKHKDVKTYEFCNGTAWHKTGTPSLTIESTVFKNPVMGDSAAPALLTGGEFRSDGFVGAYLACDQGINLLSAYLTIGADKDIGANRDKTVGATALSSRATLSDLDQSSFFSYVPQNTPWKIWVRENNGNGLTNKANCAIKVTRFGS